MSGDLPRGPDGLHVCEWCGDPIRQPATGRRRRYCKPGHREMAYRARARQGAIDQALKAAGVGLPQDPAFPPQASGPPRQAEGCPYCTDTYVDLVQHMRWCRDRPDSSVGETAGPGSVS